MRKLIVAALLTAAPALAGDLIFQADGVHVRLETSACTHKKVIDLLKPEYIPIFRNGFAVVSGKQLALCWTVSGPSEITLVDEEGDSGVLPISALKRAVSL